MHQGVFAELIYLLIISVCLVAVFKRLKLAPIIAYLLAGVVAGPAVFDLLTDTAQIQFVAELGIVFLLFSLGLEFSIPKLISMRQMVFGIGSAQVLACFAIIFAVCASLGLAWQVSLVTSCALALSSTAIVIKQLTESGKLQSKKGQLTVSILLFQDLAVVPMLIAIPIIAGESNVDISMALSIALLKGACVFGAMIFIGKWLLPKLFHEVAAAKSDELFVLTTLLVVLLTSATTHLFGLSMALGAFLAGMMLGESQYKHQLEADIRPFRDILMGLFFISVGMQLNLYFIVSHWYLALFAVTILMAGKTVIIYFVARNMNQTQSDSLSAAVMLCQMGEFGFVIAALALDNNLITPNVASMMIGVGIISMSITPYLVEKSDKISLFFRRSTPPEITEIQAVDMNQHVIICGFGRVGQTVSRFLKLESIAYIALDVDPTRVSMAKAANETIYFGDARKPEILSASNIEQAKLLIITFSDLHKTLSLITQAKKMSESIKVLVRTQDDLHLDALFDAGADEVIPENLEGRLMLVSHVLLQFSVPLKRIFGRVRRERKNHYTRLHGFYRGDASVTDEPTSELLKAVPLTHSAFAVGMPLNELDLPLKRVELVSLKRNNVEHTNPEPNMILATDDIIILMGTEQRIDAAEQFLLCGH